mmetsp:Transcript_18618/g.39141  ORF Transcript_18618/g.39141 Transcript_18618/m.39141 type:complete len:679 (+) Transcript_18618:25-2061(+)
MTEKAEVEEESAPTPIRSIDDFLEQLYQEHKRRLPYYYYHGTSSQTGTTSSDTRRGRGAGEGRSMCQYRNYLPLPLLALCIANSSDATEILMLSYLLANSQFRRDMFHDYSNGEGSSSSSSMEGAEWLAASIFMGMLLGGTVLGFLSDHIGRRPALLAGLITNATFGLLSSFPVLTPNIEYLTMTRFIAGIGIGATVPSLFSLASEWSPKEVRGAVVTMAASFWMVGSLFVSTTAWILFGSDLGHNDDSGALPMWRVFAALCALPSALGAWMVYSYVPESPRFLASAKQNYDQSAHVCNRMAESLGIKLINDACDGAAAGHPDESPSRVENALLEENESRPTNATNSWNSTSMHVINIFTEDELRQSYAPSESIGKHGINSTFTSKLLQTPRALLEDLQKLFSRKLATRTTLPLQMIWFSLSFGTYGITTWINTLFVSIHLKNIYFNSFLFALANLPGNIVSMMYSDRWGRKRMLIGSLVGSALGLGLFAILVYCGDKEGESGKNESTSSSQFQSNPEAFAIVLSACLFQMFSILSWNAIDILTGELFPTRVRSAGMGVCTACGRFGAMFAQFVNAKLMMSGDGDGAVASSSVLIVAASTLLMGAGMPLLLERDMALGELKDEVTEESSHKSIVLGCISKVKRQKDHMSDDDEMEGNTGLRSRGRPYQSFQREHVYIV